MGLRRLAFVLLLASCRPKAEVGTVGTVGSVASAPSSPTSASAVVRDAATLAGPQRVRYDTGLHEWSGFEVPLAGPEGKIAVYDDEGHTVVLRLFDAQGRELGSTMTLLAIEESDQIRGGSNELDAKLALRADAANALLGAPWSPMPRCTVGQATGCGGLLVTARPDGQLAVTRGTAQKLVRIFTPPAPIKVDGVGFVKRSTTIANLYVDPSSHSLVGRILTTCETVGDWCGPDREWRVVHVE